MHKMALKENEFVVDTRGNCFLCLNQIEQIPEQSKTFHSIQHLSKYLKLDMRKVFQVPLHLLEKVERSNLKVELCSGCSTLNYKLTETFEQLERIQMEITFKLSIISEKIKYSEESEKMNGIKKNYNSELNVEDLLGKLEIAQILREETYRKCSNQLFKTVPKVRMEKTKWIKPSTMDKESNEQETFGNIPTNNIEIKIENSPCPSLANNTDNNDSVDSDMIGHDNYYDQSSLSSSSLDSCSLSDTVTVKEETIKRKKFAKSKNKSFPTAPSPVQSGWNAKLDAAGIADKKVINPENGNHQCRICNKEYSQYCNFFRHFKAVHMKVSYTCPVSDCGKSFRRKEYYESHYENLHLGIRPQCQICKKTFSAKNHLNNHIRKVHK